MSDSPFGPAESTNRRELRFHEKLYKTVVEKATDFYVDSIPSDDVKSMPPRYMYPIGGGILLILVGIFLGVFLPSYLQAVNQQFLVPGASTSKYCNEVSISNSGTFLATQNGYWIGSQNFEYSLATYNFFVQNLVVDTPGYSELMTVVYSAIEYCGYLFKTQDLALNLLYWMTFTLVNSESSAQRFLFTGSPVIVFNRGVTIGAISNEYADCNLTSQSSFDQANGLFTFSYDYHSFISDPTCNSTLSPDLWGYNALVNVNTLSISLDVRSIVTALSVNMGIIDTQALQIIAASQNSITYTNGVTYNTSSYINPAFPGMSPIYCIEFETSNICVVSVGDIIGLPIYNHIGQNYTLPMPCNCSTLAPEDLDYKYDTCNMFKFLTGVIVYDSLSPVPLLSLALKYKAAQANEFAYYPSYVGSNWGKESPYYDSQLNTPEYRQQMYEFCNIEGQVSCSIIAFSSFDTSNGDWAVSQYYYSIPQGACKDTVSTTAENWQKLVETPFAPLTQSYSECRNSPTTVFFNQAGVAVGNVSLLSPIGVLFVLIMIGIYQRMTGFAIPKTYSRSEKDSAIDALAVALLKARDEKRKHKNSDHLKNLVTQLVDDLSIIAETSEGTHYRHESVEKFEVNWSAVVKTPFKRNKNTTTNRTISRNEASSSAVELNKMHADTAVVDDDVDKGQP